MLPPVKAESGMDKLRRLSQFKLDISKDALNEIARGNAHALHKAELALREWADLGETMEDLRGWLYNLELLIDNPSRRKVSNANESLSS